MAVTKENVDAEPVLQIHHDQFNGERQVYQVGGLLFDSRSIAYLCMLPNNFVMGRHYKTQIETDWK